MKLGIISDCIHVRDAQGRIGSANHVYVSQMNALASRFNETVFCAPVVDASNSTPSLSYYSQPNIHFIPLPQVGGKTWQHKLGIFKTIPIWFKSFRALGRRVDLIYQRFPNNLNIPGLFYVLWSKKKAFATYTGTWQGYTGESITYRFQRFLLKHLYPWPVFVYDNQLRHPRIFPTISPSYSFKQWEQASDLIQTKINQLEQHGAPSTLTLMSVGALTPYKNHSYLLQVCALLQKEGIAFELYIAGQGREETALREFVNIHKMDEQVHFLGIIPQTELQTYYRRADFVIQPSIIEGYGKVPVEAMFHGAVPLLSPVSMHPFFVGSNQARGGLIDLNEPQQCMDMLTSYCKNPSRWISAIRAGRQFCESFTLEAWTNSMLEVLKDKHIYT
ncbi:MAG: glycosyltransferase [Chitinophagaceae bacterium]|nr:glycosyltransferase [Chitinophagaceae bacterium]